VEKTHPILSDFFALALVAPRRGRLTLGAGRSTSCVRHTRAVGLVAPAMRQDAVATLAAVACSDLDVIELHERALDAVRDQAAAATARRRQRGQQTAALCLVSLAVRTRHLPTVRHPRARCHERISRHSSRRVC
jgi:hypothetical protein